MLYKDLVPMTIYRGQSHCPVPKGDPIGKGQCLVLLTPSREESMKLLAPGTFLYYRDGLYKKYFIDMLYHEKIGNKQIKTRIPMVQIQEFSNLKFDAELSFTHKSNLTSVSKSLKNIIYDMGEWNRIYFENMKKLSPLGVSKAYIQFLISKLKDSVWAGYNRTVIIDVAAWKSKLNSKITFEIDKMNNPLIIMLYALYRDASLFDELRDFNFIICNSEQKNMIAIPGTILIKENYNTILSRVSQVAAMELAVDKIEDITPNEEEILIKKNVISPSKDTTRTIEIRNEISRRIKKNFIGEVEDVESEEPEDITKLLIDEDEDLGNPDDVDLSIEDPELSDEIDAAVDEMISNNDIESLEKLITDENETEIKKAIENISKKVYVNRFMPEYSKVQINRIERLYEKQTEIFGKPQSAELQASKIIDETDLSGIVNIPNTDFLKIIFANMDKSYNKKKLERDIDGAITALSGASKKVFVVGKTVEDSSTQLTLKETRTYNLEDEDGKKMTVKFDVPKIIDDNYMFVNGNKKILQHQLVAKPIIKNKPDEVKINTLCNKLIINRVGMEDAIAAPIKKHIIKNAGKFNVKLGDSNRKNDEYISSIEYGIFSKKIYSFDIEDWHFITAIDEMCDYMTKRAIKFKKPTDDVYPVAVNTKTKEVMYFNSLKESFGEKLLSILDETDIIEINKKSISSNQFYTRCRIMEKNVPVALILLHMMGLTKMLELAKIESSWVPDADKAKLKSYDKHIWGQTRFADGTLVWKREPLENGMLMSGIDRVDFTMYDRAEMDNKDTFIYSLNKFYSYSAMSANIDQFADFMIDDITKEILEDFHLPTTFAELLLLANKMLVTLDHIPETDTRNLRVRSNELIAVHVYKAITDAYNDYRKTAHRVHPHKISIKRNEIMRRLMESGLTEDESILNPFLEVEKVHAITYRGESGIGEARAMTLDKRAYNESMLGILGITTSPDGNVGIARQLTLEPLITSTRGYLDYKGKAGVNDLSSPNLLTAGELLTPMGIEHDDPVRSAMTVKQSKFMIPIDESEPGMISNGVDRVLPYHMGKEFAIVAEDDGVVIEETDSLKVVKYNNGRYQTIITEPTVKKNGSAGFWIITEMKTHLKKGDKVEKSSLIGYEKQAFAKNNDDKSASMKRGPFVKVAFIPRWDCYEDSNPTTKKCSDSLATTMSMEEDAVLTPSTKVHYIAKIGDKINSGDPLLKFDQYADDESVQQIMEMMRSKLNEMGDEFVESSATTIKAHYTGEIVDIKMYSTVPLDQLSPSLQEIVGDYYKRLNKKIKVMQKYKNPEDNNYYMSGQMISEFPEPVAPDERGLLKGYRVGDGGVLILFYIKFKDYIKKGDKITAEFALKGINSQIIDEGLESYSEYRPDEEIGLIIAPHTPTARKTTAIFKTMFINKILIEKKRQLMDYWKSVRSSIKD